MSDIHIEEFYHDIGFIFARLYAAFPRRSNIYVEDIAGADQADEFGLHSERFLSGFSALIWLKEQGYIDFENTVKQEAVDQAWLTEKSFLTLSSQANITVDGIEHNLQNLPPYPQQKAISNIAVLRKALQSGSAIAMSQIVFHILEQSRQYQWAQQNAGCFFSQACCF